MALTNIRYAGFAPSTEADPRPQPAFYVDITESGLDSPTEADMEVPSSLGMTARAKASGPYIPAGNFAYSADIRTLGWFLKWGLMGYAFTAGPTDANGNIGPNVHEIWANDYRYFTEFCARIGKDEFEHGFERCVISTMEMTVEKEFVTFTPELTASKDFRDTLKNVAADIVPNLAEEYALSFQAVSLAIDEDDTGTSIDVSDLAMSLTCSVENNVDSERGVTLGSRFPRRHGSSGRNLTLSSELHFETLEQKEKFWGDVNGPSDIGGEYFPVEARIDSGEYGNALMRYPKCYYNAVPLTTSGREEMSQEVEMNVHTGTVTLEDGTTVVSTPLYIRLENYEGDMGDGAAA